MDVSNQKECCLFLTWVCLQAGWRNYIYLYKQPLVASAELNNCVNINFVQLAKVGNIPKSGFHKLTWDCGKQYFGNTHRKQLMKRFCFQNTYLFTNSFLQFKNILSSVMFYKPLWLTKVRTAEDLPSPLLIRWTVLWHLREGRASFSLVLRAVPVHMKGRSHSLWQFRTRCLSAPLGSLAVIRRWGANVTVLYWAY